MQQVVLLFSFVSLLMFQTFESIKRFVLCNLLVYINWQSVKKGKRKIAKRFVKVFVFFIFTFFTNFVGKAKIKPVDKESVLQKSICILLPFYNMEHFINEKFFYLIHCLVSFVLSFSYSSSLVFTNL